MKKYLSNRWKACIIAIDSIPSEAWVIRPIQILVAALIVYNWKVRRWPFNQNVSINRPTDVLKFSFDRFAAGVLKLLLISFGVYVILSIINHVVRGRWILSIGKSIDIDEDRKDIDETVKKTLKAIENSMAKDELLQESERAINHTQEYVDKVMLDFIKKHRQ